METNHSEAPELLGIGAKKGQAQALPINHFGKQKTKKFPPSIRSPNEGEEKIEAFRGRPLKEKRSPKGFPVE